MATLVSVSIYSTSPSTIEVLVMNDHPDAYDVSQVGKGKVTLEKFVEYALGLMTIPAEDEPETKQEFIKAVLKYKEEPADVKTISVGSLDSEYFLEAYKLVGIDGADYQEKLKVLWKEPENETEEELGIRIDKMEELEKPSITVELTFKPEHRNFIHEFENENFDTAYDYYTM